ncbi:cyclase family protein [Alkalihalobacillus sp. BA299]|uniref:cyclase family protein n=1 Tax=Alkalihalobacillus sp. BA299 TaxID=2815938 RepID=UPI001ADBABD9|nr:cyclase family protein [Alkalihalobacillus sp. BA299]
MNHALESLHQKKQKTKVIDFTRPLEDGMPIYPGEPEVSIEYQQVGPYATVALSLSSHSGTSADTPKHVFSGGATLDSYPIEKWISHGGIIYFDQLTSQQVIDQTLLEGLLSDITLHGSFLFIRTGWEHYWGTKEYFYHPSLSEDAASWLVEKGVALVGIDAPNTDASLGDADEVHKILLENNVLVVENLVGFNQLQPTNDSAYIALDEIFVIPLSIAGGDGAPVRAFARIRDAEFDMN